MTTTYTNGHIVDTGCYAEGHRGQYGPDHVFDLALALGYQPRLSDRLDYLRLMAEARDDQGRDHSWWECYHDASDKVTDWLNDHTVAVCEHCGNPVELVESGAWWRHQDALYPAKCSYRFMDTVVTFHWSWEDGEFFLSTSDEDDD